MDRIDLQVNVNRIPAHLLNEQGTLEAETSGIVRTRVIQAQQLQEQRQQTPNAQLDAGRLLNEEYSDPAAIDWLGKACEKLGQSARSYFRLLRVARTIADLEQVRASGRQVVRVKHVKQSMGFRIKSGNQ